MERLSYPGDGCVPFFCFFMDMQGLISFDFDSLAMEVFARIVQFSFLGLVGVAMSIVYKRKTLDEFRYFQFFRVAEIAVWAIVFTLVSYLMYQDMFIRFGILHLIATSIFIITLFANRRLALVFLSYGCFVCLAWRLFWQNFRL